MRLFRNDLEGVFLRRPNRFVVEVQTAEGVIRAHCANPGRLSEILVPRRRVILEGRPRGAPAGSSTHTLAAAYYRKRIVPLLPSRANAVARNLLIPRLFAGITDLRPEAALGEGRTDFRVDHAGGRTFLEVKSCSLVEHGVAMFPDAVSDRATRHLGALAGAEGQGMVLFVVTHGRPALFCPNLHSDPHFAEALAAYAGRVIYRAATIEADADGTVRLIEEIPVLTSRAFLVPRDCGTLAVGLRETSAPVEASFYCPGLRRALRRAAAPPARRRYPIYGSEDYSQRLAGLAPEDPLFIDEVLRLRHRGALGL
ncbi:MAG: DNA/RNA nuclease SfsA [Spirochaetaceae bacterium]